MKGFIPKRHAVYPLLFTNYSFDLLVIAVVRFCWNKVVLHFTVMSPVRLFFDFRGKLNSRWLNVQRGRRSGGRRAVCRKCKLVKHVVGYSLSVREFVSFCGKKQSDLSVTEVASHTEIRSELPSRFLSSDSVFQGKPFISSHFSKCNVIKGVGAVSEWYFPVWKGSGGWNRTEPNCRKHVFFVLFCFGICTLSLSYKLSIRFQQPVTLCQVKEQKEAPLLSSF